MIRNSLCGSCGLRESHIAGLHHWQMISDVDGMARPPWSYTYTLYMALHSVSLSKFLYCVLHFLFLIVLFTLTLSAAHYTLCLPP